MADNRSISVEGQSQPQKSILPANNAEQQLDGCAISNSSYKLIGKCFAAGSFGEIYLTRDTRTDSIVATKLVDKNNPNVNLRQEYDFYVKLGPTPGLPKVYFFGECLSYDALVMELLGPDLGQVFESCSRRFSLFATTKIAIQIIDIISHIHSQRMIFCNVKPENFCLGRPNTPYATNIHLIGLVHAKLFETESHQHIPKRQVSDNKSQNYSGFCTPRYMSLNAHKGKELSRRDDLESIGYMLIYFLRGQLPWQGLPVSNKRNKYEQIYTIKKSIKLEQLCHNLPSEYYHYMMYVRTLKFAQEPSYRYLSLMFTKLLERINLTQDMSILHKTSGLSPEHSHNGSQRLSIDRPQWRLNEFGHPTAAESSTLINNPPPQRKSVSFKADPVERVGDMQQPNNSYSSYLYDPIVSYFGGSTPADNNIFDYSSSNHNNHNSDLQEYNFKPGSWNGPMSPVAASHLMNISSPFFKPPPTPAPPPPPAQS